jgi:hypothetical protein
MGSIIEKNEHCGGMENAERFIVMDLRYGRCIRPRGSLVRRRTPVSALWFTTTLPHGDEFVSGGMLTASNIGRTSFGEESSAGSVIRCLGNSDSELSLPTTTR